MSGHSKWSTIKHTKGLVDAKRGAIFTKISKDIAVAAQLGGSGDVESNYLLRIPLEKAKAANMPNDKIENAIKRGLGLLKGENITYSKTYEAYAPDGTALLIDSSTDNPTRTVSELKSAISKNGGKFLNEGSISWMFKEVGRVIVDPGEYKDREEELFNKLIDLLPIEDIEIIEEGINKYIYIITKKEELKNSLDLLVRDFPNSKILETGVVKIPNNYKDNPGVDLETFIEKIEEVPDVDKVWSNTYEN